MLYGSESELGSDDEEDEEMATAQASKSKKGGAQVRIRMDDDEPMDLPHNISSKVTSKSFVRN